MSGGLTPELRDLVEAAPLVHLATVDPDGAPQVSVIWIGLDGDQLVSGHMSRYRKIRNVERDPRVVLSLEAQTVNERGLREYLVGIRQGLNRSQSQRADQIAVGDFHLQTGFAVVELDTHFRFP